MPALGFLKLAGANWKLVAGIVLLAAIGFLWLRLEAAQARLEAAQTYVLQLETANTENKLEIDRYQREQRRNEEAIKAEQDRRKGVQAQLSELRSRIDDAPTNGCVGPAVHAVIDGMRRQTDRHED